MTIKSIVFDLWTIGFIVVAIVSTLFYALYNHVIYPSPTKESNSAEENESIQKCSNIEKNKNDKNAGAIKCINRTHHIWIYGVGTLIGWLAAWPLYNNITEYLKGNGSYVITINISEVLLFVVAVVGIMGLLPSMIVGLMGVIAALLKLLGVKQ